MDNIPATLKRLKTDTRVAASVVYRGGPSAAEERLRTFIRCCLPTYADTRSDAAANTGSHLSPYLHYGQISPLRVALAVNDASDETIDLHMQSYLDEILVRRELSINHTWHNLHYDTPEGWPAWLWSVTARRAWAPGSLAAQSRP